jgi:hypothetical protein
VVSLSHSRLTDCIASYAEAWNSRDLDRIVGAYATPCFVVKGGQVLRHPDEPDGSVLWEFLDSYLLAADEGHWHILGDVVHT